MRAVRFATSNFEEIVAGTFFVAMCLATVSNVVARYVFNAAFEWAEEFSRYAFIWVVFMGAAVTSKQKKHIIIDAVLVAVPEGLRRAFLLVADVLVMVLMVVLLYYGWVLLTFATQPTSTLKVPQYVVYFAVPLSAFLIILHSLGDVRRNVMAMLNRGNRP